MALRALERDPIRTGGIMLDLSLLSFGPPSFWAALHWRIGVVLTTRVAIFPFPTYMQQRWICDIWWIVFLLFSGLLRYLLLI